MSKADCKLCWNATKMESSGEPDKTYKGWNIWLECPNGGILAVIVQKGEMLFDAPTFLDYEPSERESYDLIFAEAQYFIDEQEPEPTYPLLDLLERLTQ